MNEKVKTKTH